MLEWLHEWLHGLGIRYAFGFWTGDCSKAYFTGEYIEAEPTTEDGMLESTVILNGFTTGSWQGLEEAKERIRRALPQTLVTSRKEGLAVSYAGATIIPEDDISLKRIQINLTIKKWSV